MTLAEVGRPWKPRPLNKAGVFDLAGLPGHWPTDGEELVLSTRHDMTLYPEWLSHIDAPGAKEALCFIVGRAACAGSVTCHLQRKGAVRDFRFIDHASEQVFAFIINKSGLLFYFRKPAVRSGRYSIGALRALFPDAEPNKRGEWTVRLESIEDVRRLWAYLAIA